MKDPGEKRKGGYKRGVSKASGKAGYLRGRGLELKQIRRQGIAKAKPRPMPTVPPRKGKVKPRPMPTTPPRKGKFKPRAMPSFSGIEYWKK